MMSGVSAQANPAPVAAGPLLRRLVGFARFMRGNGYQVGVQEELDALTLAAHGDVTHRERLRWGLRALFCSSNEEWERFDALFDAYWKPANRSHEVPATHAQQLDSRNGLGGERGDRHPVADADQAQEGEDEDAGDGGSKGGASRQEAQAGADFRFLLDQEQMQRMERLVERLARRMRRRLTRRQRVQHKGRRIHLRHTIRNSLRYGGMPLDLVQVSRKRKLPRLILLLDVSRSMSLYSYLFLRFARGIVGAFQDADAFVYHTRLIHVTDALRDRELTRVKEKLALVSQGWSGGTRIGECLDYFNRHYGRQIVNSRSVVVMVSDGYDTGEPELLARNLRAISQRARRVVWLNPLLGREGYEPVAAGMAAALPYLDVFAPAHNLESLLALENYL
jgi:uncharacterized protein with von Willebrand factor type A (vWA) domain